MKRLTTFSLALTTLVGAAGASMAAGLQPNPSFVPAERRQADLNKNRLADNLEARLTSAPADAAVPVIVSYKPGQRPAQVAGARRGMQRLDAINAEVMKLTPAEIRTLAASGAVERVDPVGVRHTTMDTANASFGITRAAADFGLTGDGDGNPTGYSPQDLTIAVIDTGIDARHPDFAGGKVIAWKDFVYSKAQPYDNDGHGTHCASIAAGAVDRNGVSGVAPGAALIGLQVFENDGGAYDPDIIEALQWCIDNRQRYGIDVINMSLGGDESSDGQDPLSRMVNKVADAGIVVCVAAGNSGPGAYTVSSPAAAEKAITVGNMVDMGKGGFALWISSSHGPTADGRVKPDLCAPGYDILAAKANSSGYTRKTGTSMASPFTAGVAGLVRLANPQLNPAQVKALLKQTAVHFGPAGENTAYGAGRLDGYAALSKASGKTGTPPAMPTHLFATGRIAQVEGNQTWNLPVDDTRFPVGITVIAASENADFDVEVYDPNGRLVLSSDYETRQEFASFQPQRTGVYTVVVYSYEGFGDYTIDVSSGTRTQ